MFDIIFRIELTRQLFYNKRSSFVHGVEGETVKMAQGQQVSFNANIKLIVGNPRQD